MTTIETLGIETRRYDGPIYGYRILKTPGASGNLTVSENGGAAINVPAPVAASPRKLERLTVTNTGGTAIIEIAFDPADAQSLNTTITQSGLVSLSNDGSTLVSIEQTTNPTRNVLDTLALLAAPNRQVVTSAVAQAFGVANLVATFNVPNWAKRGDIWARVGTLALALGGNWKLQDEAGNVTNPVNLNAPPASSLVRILALGFDGSLPVQGSFDVGPAPLGQGGIIMPVVIVTLNAGTLNAGQTLDLIGRFQ